jgi:hypothetical protein
MPFCSCIYVTISRLRIFYFPILQITFEYNCIYRCHNHWISITVLNYISNNCIVIRKFNSAPRCKCSLYPKKYISKCQKNLTTNFALTYSQSKRICKVSPKTNTFCSLCKKDKSCHWNALFLHQIFSFYTRRFFVQRLCGHVACEDVRANFLFQFSWHFKICQICISKYREHMLQEPKHHSHCNHTLIHHVARFYENHDRSHVTEEKRWWQINFLIQWNYVLYSSKMILLIQNFQNTKI